MTQPASANYQVPTELYDVLSQLHYEEGLPADDQVIRTLVEHSGGHPRELLAATDVAGN